MKRLIILVATLSVFGCATLTDTPLPEPIEETDLPAHWSAEPSSGVVESGGEVSWDRLLDDPVLKDLVDEALRRNPSLQAAAARLDQAIARADIAGADRLPQLNASLDAARRNQNFIGFPIPGAEGQVFSTTTTTWGVGLNVSWELDLWGRIRAGQLAAIADVDAFASDLQAARLSLGGQTVKSWLALVEAEEQLRLARETVDNRRLTERRIDRRYREGLVSSLDLRLARTNLSVAEAALAARERHRDAAARQLEVLLGRYPSATVETATELPRVPDRIAAGIPAELISRRPDLIAAERRLLASNARLAQAEASLYPQFRLTGSAGTSTDELDRLLDGDFSVWSLAFNLLQPVFQGGRLRANVDLQEAIQDEVAARFVELALRAYSEVELAVAAEAALSRQERALEEAVESAGAAQWTAEERYDSGLVDYLVVLESQRQALDARSRFIEVRRQRLTSLVDLCIALGGDLPTETTIVSEETRS